MTRARWFAFGLVVTICQLGGPTAAWSAEAPPRKDWPTASGDTTNQRHTPLKQISIDNLDKLGGAWVTAAFPQGATSRATPVIHDGLMFINAGPRVHAFDAATGKEVWVWLEKEGPGTSGPQSRSGPNSQGVAVGSGYVFVGMMDGRVVALDEKTGKIAWDTNIGDAPTPENEQSVSDAPIYAKGIVLAGVSKGDSGLRGRIVAMDAKTGKILWRFFTVPAPGEFGSETWDKTNDIWKIGGGGIWQPGTVDEQLNTVYYNVGNTVPQWGGELREGDNLFTSSVVALDLKTGKRKWHFQAIHHDIWDADIATAPVLYDITMDGKPRKGVALVRPDGYLFLIDRVTGKPLVPVEERPVPQNPRSKTAKTQPFPVGGESMLPDCGYWKDHIPKGFVCDSPYFPPSFPPPSKDPQNVLVPEFMVRNTPMSYSPETGLFFQRGTAQVLWRRRMDDPMSYHSFLGFIPNAKTYGVLAAFDARTSKVVWKQMLSGQALGSGGSMTTATGLMFRLGGDGHFTAHDAKTGDIVWQFQTGYRGGAGHPASYEIGGVQYIAIPVGPVVWAFKLGGPIPESATSSTLRASGGDAYAPGGAFRPVEKVETNLTMQDMGLLPGVRNFTDPYSFSPSRAGLKVGASMTFANNGQQVYTIVADDGSWTTGPIPPGEERKVRFDKPGLHTYVSKEFPWMYGQISVTTDAIAKNGVYAREQATRGRMLYSLHCASCHLDSLEGAHQSSPLIGPTFADHWHDRTFADLYDKIRTTMPQRKPESLSAQEYLDIMTYLLQANEFPAGPAALQVQSAKFKTTIKGALADARP